MALEDQIKKALDDEFKSRGEVQSLLEKRKDLAKQLNEIQDQIDKRGNPERMICSPLDTVIREFTDNYIAEKGYNKTKGEE